MFYQELEESFFTREEPHTESLFGVKLAGAGSDRSHVDGVETDHTHALEVREDGNQILNEPVYYFEETNHDKEKKAEGQDTEVVASAEMVPKKTNLNMLSAFTHVTSDTLRTSSVFIAAIVSSVTGINGGIVDAWAALVVTFTIVAAIIPLSMEVRKAAIILLNEKNEIDQILN